MAHQPFHGSVPDDLLYDTRYDMWVQRKGDEVLIGITGFGAFLAGEIIAFTGKPKGAEVDYGRGLGTVESAKTVLAVHSPVAFTLLEVNEALEEKPAAINRDPHQSWLVRGTARDGKNGCAHLVDAAAYRAHVLSVEPEATFA
jgi:glycine cleavage system H protein